MRQDFIPIGIKNRRRMAQTPKSYQLAARLTSVEYKHVEALVSAGLFRSGADFVREAVRDKLRSYEAESVSDFSAKEAERMITSFLRANPGPHYASDIAEKLGMDYALAFKTVRRLLDSRKIRRSKVYP